MEKKTIREVIVVEGKHDSEKLKKYFDCETIITNGTHLSNSTIELIAKINNTRGIIVFTDPDYPGTYIRNKLNEKIPNLKNAFIDKALAKTSKKVGIEHANYESLDNSLKNLLTITNSSNLINSSIITELNINKTIRDIICNKLNIGYCNNKTFIKRLNMLNIDTNKLNEILEEIYEERHSNNK